MPPRPRPLPPHLGVAFSTAQAQRAGATPRRLRAADLEIPFRGSRMMCSPGLEVADDTPFARDRRARAEVLRRARAYATVMHPFAFFAGHTALVLHGAPLLGPPSARSERDDAPVLDVAVPRPLRAPRRSGIRGRQLTPGHFSIHMLNGLRVASPASAWAMLGGECSVRELVILGDAIICVPRDRFGTPRPEAALATMEHLRASVAAGSRPGVRQLRAALDRIRVGSASPLETEVRLDAAAAGLPEPVLDAEVTDGHGIRLGITEIAYPRYRLAVEVEGDHHRTSKAQWNRDIEKYTAYTAAGWEVLRLTSAHIRGPQSTATARIHSALLRRGWRG